MAVDSTMVSALHADGTPWPRADVEPGVALNRAHEHKSDTYPEVEAAAKVHLATVACEVGGRWSEACLEIVDHLAHVRARKAPAYLRAATKHACAARWWALLFCAQQDALATTLIQNSMLLFDGRDAAFADTSFLFKKPVK